MSHQPMRCPSIRLFAARSQNSPRKFGFLKKFSLLPSHRSPTRKTDRFLWPAGGASHYVTYALRATMVRNLRKIFRRSRQQATPRPSVGAGLAGRRSSRCPPIRLAMPSEGLLSGEKVANAFFNGLLVKKPCLALTASQEFFTSRRSQKQDRKRPSLGRAGASESEALC